jgi:hypothetical protein
MESKEKEMDFFKKLNFLFVTLLVSFSCSTYPPFKSVENYFCSSTFKTYEPSKKIINSYESCEGQLIRGGDKFIYNFKVAKISNKMEVLGYANLRLEVKYKDKPDNSFHIPSGSRYPSRVKYGDLFIEEQKFNLTWENSWITLRDDNTVGREINIIIEKDITSESHPGLILKSGPSLLIANNIEFEKMKNKDVGQ